MNSPMFGEDGPLARLRPFPLQNRVVQPGILALGWEVQESETCSPRRGAGEVFPMFTAYGV